MGKIFVLITQLRNSTNQRIGFRIDDDDGYCPLPDLPPEKTRKVKLSAILRCCRRRESADWTIDVLIDSEFTGMQLKPKDVLNYARIVFEYETNRDGPGVACVNGVPENCSDFFFRLKFFGWMRNRVWDKRQGVQIARADSKLARKLRDLEAPAQNLDPFAYIDTAFLKRQYSSPKMKGDNLEQKDTEMFKKRSDEIEKDTKKPERYLKEHKSKGQANVTTAAAPTSKEEITTTALPPHERSSKSRELSSITVDRTAAGGRMSPDHVGLQRPTMRDEHMDYDRGYMDSFVHGLLFMFAFAMVGAFVWGLYRILSGYKAALDDTDKCPPGSDEPIAVKRARLWRLVCVVCIMCVFVVLFVLTLVGSYRITECAARPLSPATAFGGCVWGLYRTLFGYKAALDDTDKCPPGSSDLPIAVKRARLRRLVCVISKIFKTLRPIDPSDGVQLLCFRVALDACDAELNAILEATVILTRVNISDALVASDCVTAVNWIDKELEDVDWKYLQIEQCISDS
ncbi:hypothetical protein BUALT_Bualt05G0019500 [Buddleja alternifolia]|uniref:Transmembrane protein n=1 Tax=Buddleja alternifolia TaxID=168488 RepID=A0AAV6XPC8_9LAMI|nr:hypothetical protein BUALT_Bualt05G0019500 [Buddleja alternifolia]